MWMRILCLVIFIFFGYTELVLAMEVRCPPQKVDASPDSITNKIESCIQARENRDEASLNTPTSDFYCPSGDFSLPDNQPITEGRLAMQIGISVLFSAIDYDVMTKICAMRESRETNGVQWQEEIQKSFLTSPNDIQPGDSGEKSALARYRALCENGGINVMRIVNANSQKKLWISSTMNFPESICLEKAKQKSKMWSTLGYILMNKGIAKGYQNDKDEFLEKVKLRYDSVREGFHRLLEYVDKSTMNLTNLIKQAVK